MKRIALMAAVAAVALGSSALAQESWSTPAKPFQIMGDTWYVGTEGLSSYLVKTPAGLVVIDAGLPGNAALVERNIERLGLKLRDVKYLLLTHAHYDHAGGMAKLKADTGAALVTTEGERYALEKGVYPGSEDRKDFDFPPVKVDRTLKDGETLDVGGVKFTAHLTPGHTKGCTTWTWPVKDKDGSAHTAIDFCSASVAANSLVPEQYPGEVADYRRTFRVGPSIAGDLFLAPHGEQFGMKAKRARLGQPGPNPFLDRAGYERLLASQKADFEKQLAAAQAKAQTKAK
jgi:metallo-beta-lactamase class B